MSRGGSDNLDTAAELQQLLNDAATARVRLLAAPESHPDFDGKHCVDCGDEIIIERLRHGRMRCVGCQSEKESRERK